MRILAIDYGTKRIGIALSDELKVIAQPLEYIPAEPFAGFLMRLQELLEQSEVELILVGMPRNMDGTYGPAALRTREFVETLKSAVCVPIKTWDEKVDKMAAAILLQSYLDSLSM